MFEKKLSDLKADYQKLEDEYSVNMLRAKEIREEIGKADNLQI